ncbi:DUF3397 domain-containing protein [Vagococcus luciliae]|uniref:DUF3397 domain-containing protein n=1 Tax=Vagococcus luciliae TaxID=2920380 RepID=A0ABY5NWH6_9ENTE|nr:DUF3397 domain-containing protein [Vagococcus luciliae]UUV97959.1 hypothetical protein G314FT_00490 [Vagococcus luciliae]
MPNFTVALFFWYLFPVIVIIASNLLVKKTNIDKKYGIKTPDIVTPFFFIGLHFVSVGTLGKSFLAYVFLMIFFIGMIVAIMLAYYFHDINYRRYFKILWRLAFLVTLMIYVVLIIGSIILFLKR